MKEEPMLLPWAKDYDQITPKGQFVFPPRTIYRYLPLKRVDSLITEEYLFFSSPDNFNDPLDMHLGLISFNMHKTYIKNAINNLYPKLSSHEKKVMANLLRQRPLETIDGNRRDFEKLREESGVCCFSKYFDKTLMWSHYADSHKGLVFGFNFEPLPKYGFSPVGNLPNYPLIQPVTYPRQVIPIEFYDLNSGAAIRHFIYTKAPVWEYEGEVRAFISNKKGKVHFKPECLKEVYFGCKVDNNQIKELIKLLKDKGYHDVQCFKMEIDSSIFDIKPVKIHYID